MMWRPSNWSSANTPSSTPPPQQSQVPRSYAPSPLGRRMSTSRPQLASRVSSMSFLNTPNASTTSLPGTLKQQQEPPSVGYRKAISQPPPAGVKDPLDVLEGILGASVRGSVGKTEEKPMAPPELRDAEEIEFGELSLEEFVLQHDEAGNGGTKNERVFSEKSAEEYEKEKDRFQDLHRSIKACDEVLKSVESYLSAFQTDLGVVSAEIETLQNRSTTLNKRLENRKNVEKLLGPVVDDIILPPNDVRRLVEGDVNDTWVKTLQEIDRRMKAIDTKDPTKVKAVQEIKPELEKITNKAIERVRDFFVSRIKAIRIPGTNAQTVQQSGFLRYRELFQFMASHHADVAEEIGQAYINTMRWYYLSHFQRYVKGLERVKVHILDKNDTLGTDSTQKNNLLIPSLKSAAVPAHDPFNIGRRIEILKNRTAPIVAVYQVEDDKATHYAEYPFRHLSAALIENVSSEYGFITDFFTHKTYDQAQAIFNQIFEPTFALTKAYIRTLIDSTMDSFAMLICVRLNQDAAFEMQKRRCPAADAYINGLGMLLWPRFQNVMDAHCESLRKRSGNTHEKLGLAPHPFTQRFASFAHGLLILSAEAGDDEPVSNSLARLRTEFEACLTRISKAVPEGKKRETFLGNNYSLVVTIIGDTEGKLAVEWKQHFDTLRKAFQE